MGCADAEDILAKARMTTTLDAAIKRRGWSSQRAAAALGVRKAKLRKVLDGRFHKVSARELASWVTAMTTDQPSWLGIGVDNRRR
nr:XRE family transcriptional regulator [Pinirhizobacter soli]